MELFYQVSKKRYMEKVFAKELVEKLENNKYY